MATVKFVAAAGKYQDDDARHDLIHYMIQKSKTPNHIINFSHGDISQAADQMTNTAKAWNKDAGVRICHFIISFAPGDINSMECMIYAANEIMRLLSQRHEIAYAVHEDTRIPHIHFAFNPVSYIDGYKYHGGKQEFKELMDMLRGVMNYIGVYQFFRVKYVIDGNPHE